MANKLKIERAGNTTQILFMTQPYAAVGIIMSADGALDVDGRKIHKAGTPVAGDLTARSTSFSVASGADAVGVLLHDVDVTDGADNTTMLCFGFVDLNKLETEAVEKITDAVKTALDGKVYFLK